MNIISLSYTNTGERESSPCNDTVQDFETGSFGRGRRVREERYTPNFPLDRGLARFWARRGVSYINTRMNSDDNCRSIPSGAIFGRDVALGRVLLHSETDTQGGKYPRSSDTYKIGIGNWFNIEPVVQCVQEAICTTRSPVIQLFR